MPTAPRGSLLQSRGVHYVVLLRAYDVSRRVAAPFLDRAPARGVAAFQWHGRDLLGWAALGGPAEHRASWRLQ
eukprot:8429193-Pyramimonas_sp.AAC.1